MQELHASELPEEKTLRHKDLHIYSRLIKEYWSFCQSPEDSQTLSCESPFVISGSNWYSRQGIVGFVFARNFVQAFWITLKIEVQQVLWTLAHIRPPSLWKDLFLIFSENSPHSSICFLPVVLPVSSQGSSFSTSSYDMVADVNKFSPCLFSPD